MSSRLIDIIDTTDMEIIKWLRSNKDVLSFNSIEDKYGIPQGTLSKVIKGKRPLPKKWIPVLEELKNGLNK